MADVVIDVAVGARSGIPPGPGVLELAQLIDTLPNLKLRGMLSYDGGVQHAKGFANRKARALKTIEANTESFLLLKKAGLNTEIYSGGGTGTYNIYHSIPGFSDVQVGSYIFMDLQYLGNRQREQRAGLRRLRAVAHRADDGPEQPLARPADDRCRKQGAHAQHAGAQSDRRAGHGIQSRLGRVRRHPLQRAAVEGVQDRRPARAPGVALRSGREPVRPDLRHSQATRSKWSGLWSRAGSRSNRHSTDLLFAERNDERWA